MYTSIIEELNKTDITLVAVSKTKPLEKILEIYNQGQRIFGENRVQEMVEKQEALPKDIQWHQIGQLQRNKVKYIAPFVALIHSVDSRRLLEEINKQAAKNERVIDVLLQVKIAEEDSKAGWNEEEIFQFLIDENWKPLVNIRICGLMGMATFTSDENQVKEEFRNLKNIFDKLKTQHFKHDDSFKHLSMGMSGDYQLAIEQGSNMVRIGSLIFGSRQ